MSNVILLLKDTERICIVQCHWRLAKKILQEREHTTIPHKHLYLDAGYIFIDKQQHIFLNQQTGFKHKV